MAPKTDGKLVVQLSDINKWIQKTYIPKSYITKEMLSESLYDPDAGVLNVFIPFYYVIGVAMGLPLDAMEYVSNQNASYSNLLNKFHSDLMQAAKSNSARQVDVSFRKFPTLVRLTERAIIANSRLRAMQR